MRTLSNTSIDYIHRFAYANLAKPKTNIDDSNVNLVINSVVNMIDISNMNLVVKLEYELYQIHLSITSIDDSNDNMIGD